MARGSQILTGDYLIMAIFRADHYLIAEFKDIEDTKTSGQKVLDALSEMSELKDLAIVSKRLEGKQWSEILGRIDVSAGSKAFWAMIKKDVSEREPYNLFIRFDRNAEAETIEEAREKVKTWVESEIVPKIKSKIAVKTIKVLQPNEVFMPKLE
ncbi:MAG: hypothetical protein BAJATHORv1_100069 [Candidatus Thorarchaeota archaeon]|nr:MAG: hypothetical protein BAJATHORv1_100069 [Candidatus Thorarchaeota archaeon]